MDTDNAFWTARVLQMNINSFLFQRILLLVQKHFSSKAEKHSWHPTVMQELRTEEQKEALPGEEDPLTQKSNGRRGQRTRQGQEGWQHADPARPSWATLPLPSKWLPSYSQKWSFRGLKSYFSFLLQFFFSMKVGHLSSKNVIWLSDF